MLKDFSSKILFLALEAILFCGAETLCSFSRRHSGEHSCETILNFDKWLRRICRLKEFTSKILFIAIW